MAMSLYAVVSLAIVAGVKSNPHVRYAFICFGERSLPCSRNV
jgi:hypothetical protein